MATYREKAIHLASCFSVNNYVCYFFSSRLMSTHDIKFHYHSWKFS